MRRMLKTGLAFCGAALLLYGALLALNAARATRDKGLLETIWPLPLQTELLPPETETLPLVAALWQRARFYEDWSFYGSETAGDSTAPEDQTRLQEMCAALETAGVLPPDLSAAAQIHLLDAQWPMQEMSGRLGFVQVYQQSCQAETWNGFIVRFSASLGSGDGAAVSNPQASDYAALAQSYLTYLALDTLPDWESVAVTQSRGSQGYALYSESAQLYLSVIEYVDEEQYRSFLCSVTSVPPEAVARGGEDLEKNLLQSRVS